MAHVPTLRPAVVPPTPPPNFQTCAKPSVQPATYSSYTRENFRHKVYDSVEERNKLYYDHFVQPPLQIHHNNSYFENIAPGPEHDVSVAPRDSYFGLHSTSTEQLIGNLGVTPNLYDDIVRPGVPTLWEPNLTRTGQPLSTSAMDPTAIKSLQWRPHTPCEVAPRHSSDYWVPGLDSKLYERSLLMAADEQPYANFNRVQTFVNLLGINMSNKKDMYTRPLKGKTYCETVKTEGQPAASVF